MGGKLLGTNQPTTDDTTTKNEELLAAQLEQTQNSTDSLLNISNATESDIWQYQGQLDAIILSYYNTDYSRMFTQMEELVKALYADTTLTYPPAEDYSTYETLPEDFWNMSMFATIRFRLAYRDQILKERLGSYADYEQYILMWLDNDLALHNPNENESAFYNYATKPAEERDGYYPAALSDILSMISSGFDIADNFTPPM